MESSVSAAAAALPWVSKSASVAHTPHGSWLAGTPKVADVVGVVAGSCGGNLIAAQKYQARAPAVPDILPDLGNDSVAVVAMWGQRTRLCSGLRPRQAMTATAAWRWR